LVPRPKSEFGPGKDPYSTFPEDAKWLQHQTLKTLTPREEREQFLMQVEEAKTKVKPIEFSQEDREKYLKTRD